jgi:hemerythrin-like domain-containing protein
MSTHSALLPTTRIARELLLAMLKDDHRRLLQAFADFDRLPSNFARQRLVQSTCVLLKVHAAIEDELVYPALRHASLEAAAHLDEAEVEHGSIQRLTEQVERLSPEDERHAASVRVLGEYLTHHVHAEENELLPRLSRQRLDWDELLHAVDDRRAVLCEDLGMAEDQRAASATPLAGTVHHARFSTAPVVGASS